MNDRAFQILFRPDDIVEIRALHRDGPRRQSWWKASELPSERVRSHITTLGKEGYDIYFGANPRRAAGAANTNGVSAFRAVFVDLDHVTLEDARIQLMESGLPAPSITVTSGRGVHLYWALDDSPDAETWRKAQKCLIQRFSSADPAIHDPARIMRYPGTINTKCGARAEAVVVDTCRYSTAMFLHPSLVTTTKKSVSAPARFRKYLEKVDPVTEGRRNTECYRLACVGHDMDLDVSAIMDGMRTWNATKVQPPLEEGEILKTVMSAMATAKSAPGSKNRELPGRAGVVVPFPGQEQQPPKKKPEPDLSVLDQLSRDCRLIVGTTQVWHNGLRMSMPMEALLALYPVEAKIWRMAKDRQTVKQSDIVFEPDVTKVREGQVNLWEGLELQPDPRPCPMLAGHIDVICGRDKALSDWMRCWLAIQIQRPGTKLDTALIVHGKPGSGKSIFFSAFRAIFGRYGVKATQTTIDSDYTGWMSQKLFVQCEEVGSTRGQVNRLRNVLKDWITGEQIEIREKYQVSRTETAHANFVFLSNDAIPLPIDADDRRFTVIRHDHIPDRDYFVALGQEIADNGPARLMHYLSQVDLGEFWEHTPPPHTPAKDDLADLCKTSPQIFLEEWERNKIEGLPFISASCSDLYLAYAAWARLNNYKVEPAVAFHKRLKMDANIRRERTEFNRYYFVDSIDLSRFQTALSGYLVMVDQKRIR